VWADTVTLRVGDQLVGVRADTDATAATLRTVFAAWLEPTATGEQGEPVPWAFSLRLDTDRAGRGPKAVPQLRIGRSLLARSRRPDDVVTALDHVLGGVLARQDDSRRWLGLRTFVAGDRAVLVDATPPALTADPRLARAGVTELPTWSVAVDGDTVLVPPPLTAADASHYTRRSSPDPAAPSCSRAPRTRANPPSLRRWRWPATAGSPWWPTRCAHSTRPISPWCRTPNRPRCAHRAATCWHRESNGCDGPAHASNSTSDSSLPATWAVRRAHRGR
jgi:hypothetical protein